MQFSAYENVPGRRRTGQSGQDRRSQTSLPRLLILLLGIFALSSIASAEDVPADSVERQENALPDTNPFHAGSHHGDGVPPTD